MFVVDQLYCELTKASHSLFQSVEWCGISWPESYSVFMVIAFALSTTGRTDTTSVRCINTRCGSTTQAGEWPRWQPYELTLSTYWWAAWVCTIVKNTNGLAGYECNIPKCHTAQVTSILLLFCYCCCCCCSYYYYYYYCCYYYAAAASTLYLLILPSTPSGYYLCSYTQSCVSDDQHIHYCNCTKCSVIFVSDLLACVNEHKLLRV